MRHMHLCLAHNPVRICLALQFSSTAVKAKQLVPRKDAQHQLTDFEIRRRKAIMDDYELSARKYYQLDIRKDAALGPRVVWARERAKDAGYSVIIIIGFGLLVGAFYSLFRNIFSSHGTTVLFNKAVADCLAHGRVTSILGKPIKAFGEETRRGHRGHIPAYHYIDPQSGRKGVLIRFYLQGVRRRGSVQLDAREDSKGKMQTRFLIVQIGYNTVVVVDNRHCWAGPAPKREGLEAAPVRKRDPFSYHGTTALFNKAMADCLAHEGVTNILGRPIKAYGEESKHGQRLEKSKLSIPATQYSDPGGRRGVRIHFYLQGSKRGGTVFLDAKEDSEGKMQTCHLVVQIDGNTVVVVDDRQKSSIQSAFQWIWAMRPLIRSLKWAL